MTRFADGPNISPAQIAQAASQFRAASSPGAIFPIAPKEHPYGFLFDDLQADPANLLIPAQATAKSLIALGETMVDPDPRDTAFDSKIPSAYTYLGQLIDHDVTRQSFANQPTMNQTTLPLSVQQVHEIPNARSAGLDLDCIYGPAIEQGTSYEVPRDTRNPEKLRVERMAGLPPTPELPRERDSPHAARIGDRRNDENLIISQLHLAFMLAHNKLVDEGATFENARQQLRRHYQWIVVNDYLPRIADPAVVKALLDGEIEQFDPPDDNSFMPVEFAVAAFRFGHTMIRDVYNYNSLFERVPLFQLLLPGFLTEYHHVPVDWTIDWTRFFDGRNMARRFDTTLAQGLTRLDDGKGHPLPFGLATFDLLKGFFLRLPTGEAVARRLKETELSTGDLLKVVSKEQGEVLSKSFAGRTPLWFYILAEAQASDTGRLGRVGSRIVASVLIGLVRKSKDSYLRIKDWSPTMGTQSRFNLPDLFQFTGLLRNDK